MDGTGLNADATHAQVIDDALGTDVYYATLFETPGQRLRLVAWDRLAETLLDTPLRCQDPGVAHMRLGWWAEACHAASGESPRHPLLAALVRSGDDLPIDGIAAILSACAQRLQAGAVNPGTSTEAVARLGHGTRWRVLAELAAVGDRGDIAEAIGAVQGRLQTVTRLGEDLRHGRCLLPVERLREAGFDFEDVRDPARQAALGVTLAEDLSRWHDEVRPLRVELGRDRGSLSLRIMASCLEAQLRALAADAEQLLTSGRSPSAVYKLGIAVRQRLLPS